MSPICLDMNVIFPGLGENQAKNPGLAKMTAQLTRESATLFSEGRYLEFDAPVGNFGCQSLALYLLGLARSSVLSPEQMTNLIRCRLLSIASEAATEENITGELRCDDKKLRSRFGISGEIARKVINIAKQCLAADTILYTQNETDRIRSLPEKERDILQKMVGKIVVLPGQTGTYLTFASTSSTLKVVLRRIMETGAVVALKKLTVSQNAAPPLYYRFDQEERRFCELNPTTLDPMEPVALIEATFRDDAMDSEEGRKDVRMRINRYGLEKIILACAAQSPQFVPNRPDILPGLKDPFEEAVFELAERERAKLIFEASGMECNLNSSPFIDPNHISLSSVSELQRMITL